MLSSVSTLFCLSSMIKDSSIAFDFSISFKLLVTPSVGLVRQICNKLISNSSILKNHIQEVHEGFQQNKIISIYCEAYWKCNVYLSFYWCEHERNEKSPLFRYLQIQTVGVLNEECTRLNTKHNSLLLKYKLHT